MTQAARAAARRPRRDTARRRAERAQRILDAAAELVLRLGYDKTTIDDVARRAGVAKGTIYLHWTSREALFAALLRRERLELVTEIRRQARAEGSVTVHGIFQALALELMRRPLLKAALVRDSDVLGKLLQMKQTSTTTAELSGGFGTLLDTLSEYGLMRSDRTVADHVKVVGTLLYGTLVITPYMPGDYQVTDERLAELVGDALQRTLVTGRRLSAREQQVVTTATLDYLDHVVDVAERKFRASLGGDFS